MLSFIILNNIIDIINLLPFLFIVFSAYRSSNGNVFSFLVFVSQLEYNISTL